MDRSLSDLPYICQARRLSHDFWRRDTYTIAEHPLPDDLIGLPDGRKEPIVRTREIEEGRDFRLCLLRVDCKSKTNTVVGCESSDECNGIYYEYTMNGPGKYGIRLY